jgi:hypothetical protein
MRKQRSGLLLTLSSTAGISGLLFCTAYAAAKFGVEGWMESLAPEIAPFGIRTMLVEPGFFRTELLSKNSTTYAKPAIDDYAKQTREIVTAWSSMDGKQGGDPAKLADALVHLAGLKSLRPASPLAPMPCRPSRPRPMLLLTQANAYRELSSSLPDHSCIGAGSVAYSAASMPHRHMRSLLRTEM